MKRFWETKEFWRKKVVIFFSKGYQHRSLLSGKRLSSGKRPGKEGNNFILRDKGFGVRGISTLGGKLSKTKVLLAFTSGFIVGFGPRIMEELKIRTDEETLKLFQPEHSDPNYEVNEYIVKHGFTKFLQSQKELSESRPHLKLPESFRAQSFMSGVLMGEGMITVPPLTFSREDGKEMIQILHLGKLLCGFPGIIHGGLLATILDEGLGRCCFPALPKKFGVTASLQVEYKKPCKAGQYIVLWATTKKVEGRKAWVTGKIFSLKTIEEWNKKKGFKDEESVKTFMEDCEKEVLVEANGLFMEPKMPIFDGLVAKMISGQTS